MTRLSRRFRTLLILAGPVMLLLGLAPICSADPSKYPEFAQQSVPDNVTPSLIGVDELVEAIKAGGKPLIIDVRTEAEFQEAHILSAQSAPLASFKEYVKSIPRDRLVVLY